MTHDALKILSMLDLENLFRSVATDIEAVVKTPAFLLGVASPPPAPGVYMLLVGDKVMYVGEARGQKGLSDRLLSKHLSGDDNHTIQRAFRIDFPDRLLRRDYIRANVLAKWLEIGDSHRLSAVERVLILLY